MCSPRPCDAPTPAQLSFGGEAPAPGAQTDLFRLGEGDDFGSAFLYLRRRRPGQAWYGEVASRRHQVAEGRIERTIPFRISAEEQAEIERMRANIALSE